MYKTTLNFISKYRKNKLHVYSMELKITFDLNPCTFLLKNTVKQSMLANVWYKILESYTKEHVV